jgi:hypothetical protein
MALGALLAEWREPSTTKHERWMMDRWDAFSGA